MGLLDSFLTFFRGPRRLGAPGDRRAGRPQISPPTYSQSDWLAHDLEDAMRAADSGAMRLVARLANACRRDGTIAGVLSTRTLGMLALPFMVSASPELMPWADRLREDFAVMFPAAELEAILADGIVLRFAVGEFVQPAWARLPTLRRLDPEFLQYRWQEDAWYYASASGLLRIEPGDGRWLLHLPGGHVSPWKSAPVWALGRAFIMKQSAIFLRENYNQKLANAARAAKCPKGTTNEERAEQLEQLIGWGPNAAFVLPDGYEIEIIESNGRGHESFGVSIVDCDREAVITLSGQTVTTEGAAGFANGAIFERIRGDLIQSDANGLAETLLQQGLPLWGWMNNVDVASFTLRWETKPPRDRTADATASMQAAQAIKAWIEVGADVDVSAEARTYGVTLIEAPPAPAQLPSVNLVPDADVEMAVDIEDTAAEDLASKMTEHAVERCPHGSNNRCPRCGIERIRDFDLQPDGSANWHVIWRAIPKV